MAKRKSKSLQDAQSVKEDLSIKQEGLPSLKKFKVQLTYLPEMEIEAFDDKEAIEYYNKFTGVINTTNQYQITIL